ncbi:hypothetical protein PHYSODRAFT_305612 [Phytophthora sojae]|uniref:Uncharacterized protein n=1 Tax=Phytophthora sojae (strain P6497) TaxID=1094619 RepID=G5A5U6_PHYSP|nr:hypothetical protein PHYSODRAFT_305612 [Phytophthora sojae]EGZ08701.1 hypothetical protein PHYSODRAFT_305612 [Phytophthora sojae]|eukprot:XP_009535334.1 hypothetical protein PHYSODRAFT_305612 [Phytophthora sojae]
MTPIWVQSHKEMEFTPDTTLRSKRHSLAVVDEAAKASHLINMQASYSRWIEYDDFMLIDEEGALVFGNTLAYLLKRVHGDQRRRWFSRQQEKDESHHTLAQDEVAMIADSQWSEALRRFYWRARANVLHTNAIKHRYDPRWSAACSSCGNGITDTQHHRFGLTTPICHDVSVLNDMLTELFYEIDCEEWLPDQCVFIPAIAHQLATETGSDQRSGWLSTEPGKVLWSPMVKIVNGLWVNAQWLDWFGDPRVLCLDSQFASVVERELSHIGRPRCILPAEFADVVQRYHTTVGFFRAYITQWILG